MVKYVQYTHPAATGYNAELTYKLDDVIKTEGIEMVKILFTPINFKWEDLEDKQEITNKRNR